MKPKYFGTDGIRGKANTDLNANLAYKLGNALKDALNIEELVIGLDTRASSNMLAYMVAAGAMQAGIDVYFAGVISTPAIAYYSKLKGIGAVMITASHNVYTDNGIKVFNRGSKSTTSEELIIEEYINEDRPLLINKLGKFILTENVLNAYLNLIEKLELQESNIKFVYDSANGANYNLANKVLSSIYPNSIQIGNKPDGYNINKDYGSTSLRNIKDYIINNKMDIGIAFDGDGDRLLILDENANVYDGDYIILLIAKYLKKHNLLKNNGVVLTKMSNPGILKALHALEIDYYLTDVGDKYVYEAMISNDYVLGGEASGHIINTHLLHSGDGLIAALYILMILKEEEKSLKELFMGVKMYPFKMVNILDVNKNVLKERVVKNFLDKQASAFREDEIFFIRPSGTEPLIRVTISSSDEKKLNKYMDETVAFIKERGRLKWKDMD